MRGAALYAAVNVPSRANSKYCPPLVYQPSLPRPIWGDPGYEQSATWIRVPGRPDGGESSIWTTGDSHEADTRGAGDTESELPTVPILVNRVYEWLGGFIVFSTEQGLSVPVRPEKAVGVEWAQADPPQPIPFGICTRASCQQLLALYSNQGEKTTVKSRPVVPFHPSSCEIIGPRARMTG